MVRKKNKMFVDSADRTPHYSLRKLSVGVASVLLSTTLWMGANGSVAHADTINDATATVAGKASRSADTENKQAQEGDSANAEAQTTTANDAQADVAKQEPAAPSQQTAPQAQVSAPKTSAANKKMVMASLAGTASAGGKNTAYDNQNQAIVEGKDQISFKNGELSSLANRAKQDGLTVNKEDDKTYADKQEALADLDKQTADIQSTVTKYEAEKAAYDAAKTVYDEDEAKWEAAQSSTDPHMVKGISQGLSFANEHDASLDVTSGSDKSVNFIKSSAWLGSDGMGVYTDGIYNGGNISKSFSNSDISHSQADGTGKDIKNWGNTYTGVQLKVGEGVVASYTGLKNSVYIDNSGDAHKLGKVQVEYKLTETTANDGSANIFLSNNPNIALWYGAAGNRNGSVDLTVDLTFYDENGNRITLGKGSNAWLDMSSLNNGTTKVEYFTPNGNPAVQIPGSTIKSHANGWYADGNNERNSAEWDNPTSAIRYYAAAIMEFEGNSFHIGQKITRNNVYSWFALDSSLAAAYKPVEPKAPAKPIIAWHEVTYEPQKATVTYIDDTTNTTLETKNLSGDSGADSGYNTKSSIGDYENKGYEVVSDDTNGADVVFDHDSSVDQSYFVHLKHATEPK
ncbi:GbpC/Spa domain-containing protein, partial [Lactobacillus johnsonii]|uniref:GbpC/Spa domain-containing protein n=1 Tax=Lactobacillus johnsonii TaxID=33959 RepID=UPI003651DB70